MTHLLFIFVLFEQLDNIVILITMVKFRILFTLARRKVIYNSNFNNLQKGQVRR